MLNEVNVPGFRTYAWWRAASVIILILVAQYARPTLAAPADPKKEAMSHFLEGQKHYNLSEFSDALVEFKAAYRIQTDPILLYNIGQCERQLGHLEEAIRFYRNYLREQSKAPNREEVERRIDELEGLLKAREAEAKKGDNTGLTPSPTPIPAPLPSSATPVSAGRADLTTPAAESTVADAPPIYSRWWFWPAVATVAVGATIGIVIAASGGQASPPATGLGSQGVF
jgi:tetratricopeptide (TPR) repeat protein